MIQREKLSVFYVSGGYFLLGALVLAIVDWPINPGPKPQATDVFKAYALLSVCVLSFTVMPWLAVRHAHVKLFPISLETLSLFIIAVSLGGLMFAMLTALMGNSPGFICYVVQGVHAFILALSSAAYFRNRKSEFGRSVFLRLCAGLYFFSGWVIPLLKNSLQCSGGCTDTRWAIFGLGLFDINIIVSPFMGFFVWRTLSLAKQRG